MPARYYSTEHALAHTAVGSGASDQLLRFVHIDACLLVCGRPGNYRCEEVMQRNFHDGGGEIEAHMHWIRVELAKPARWRVVVGHWPLYSFYGNGI